MWASKLIKEKIPGVFESIIIPPGSTYAHVPNLIKTKVRFFWT
jgi:hypothetical protein